MEYLAYLLQSLNNLYKKIGSSNSEKRALITFCFIASINIFFFIWIVSPSGKYLSDFILFGTLTVAFILYGFLVFKRRYLILLSKEKNGKQPNYRLTLILHVGITIGFLIYFFMMSFL